MFNKLKQKYNKTMRLAIIGALFNSVGVLILGSIVISGFALGVRNHAGAGSILVMLWSMMSIIPLFVILGATIYSWYVIVKKLNQPTSVLWRWSLILVGIVSFMGIRAILPLIGGIFLIRAGLTAPIDENRHNLPDYDIEGEFKEIK